MMLVPRLAHMECRSLVLQNTMVGNLVWLFCVLLMLMLVGTVY